MNDRPIILVSPSTERKGAEFADASISLSNRYTEAVIASGGLPQILPSTTVRAIVSEFVRRSDGVLLTGGDDIQPHLYDKNISADLASKVGGIEPERDAWEQLLIEETFAQRKPLLGICRGHQMINVALGGTLIVDIPTQVPGALQHKQMDRKSEPVHEISVEPGSLFARITGTEKIAVNSTHHQALGRIADPLHVTATCSDGIVEVTELKDLAQLPFFLTVQFHPERLLDRYKTFLKIFESFVDAADRSRSKKL
ncbi:MAG: gamma-glutamyl-gamma-aminobutyrate hydrolase family protein [Limisphaerales bacterium]